MYINILVMKRGRERGVGVKGGEFGCLKILLPGIRMF